MRIVDDSKAQDFFVKMGNLYENSGYVIEDYKEAFGEAGLDFDNVCYKEVIFYNFYYVENEFSIPLRINPLPPKVLIQELRKSIQVVQNVKKGKVPVREILDIVERKYHLYMMEEIYWEISNIQSVREAFREVYTGIENGFDRMDREIFEDAFSLSTKDRENNIAPLLKLLEDDMLTIYRGQTESSTDIEMAHSWTTDRKIAEFFATRYDSDGDIYRAKIHRDDILYYTNNRKEEEVIVEFSDLENVETI